MVIATSIALTLHSGQATSLTQPSIHTPYTYSAARIPSRGITVRAPLSQSSNAESSNDATPEISPSTLKTIISQKEAELASITSPERIPPKSSIIAAMRKEISLLQRQLSLLGGDFPVTLASDSTPTTTISKSMPVSSPAMPASIPKGARGALLLVEQQLAVASSGSDSITTSTNDRVRSALHAVEQGMALGTILGSSDLAELESLQQENARLKTQLESLLVKKQLLADISEKKFGKKKTTTKRRTTKKGSDESSGAEKSDAVVKEEQVVLA